MVCGANTWTAGLTPDGNTGSFAEQISVSSFTSGDRRLVTSQDLGACAPPVTVGDTYTASAYLKGQGTVKWVAYYRESQGGWIYWAQSATINMGSSFAQTSWTTPAIPSGATALSFGISLRSIATFTADDFHLSDNGPADQTSPAVSVTAPKAGATVNGPVVYISANATDNVGVSSVKFALDGAVLGSKTAPTVPGGSAYQWKWDASSAGAGQHTLTSIATDAAGNQTTSAPVTVTVAQVDTQAPTAQITAPTTAATVSGMAVYIVAQATDNVSVRLRPLPSGRRVLGSKTAPTGPGGSTYQWKWDASSAAAGQHTLTSIATDAAGNQTTSAPVTVAVAQVDTQAPTAQITAPTTGATVSGMAVYIVAQATDNVSVSSVRFLLDGVSLGSKTAPTVPGGSTYQWKWDASSAGAGQHTLTSIATDAAGNQTTSAPVVVTVA